MNRHLNTQVRSGVPVNDEALWDHVYDSFRRQYADMQEQERAEDTLQRGISMRSGELDTYCTLQSMKSSSRWQGTIPTADSP